MKTERAILRGGPENGTELNVKFNVPVGHILLIRKFLAGMKPTDKPVRKYRYRRAPLIENGKRVYEYVR